MTAHGPRAKSSGERLVNVSAKCRCRRTVTSIGKPSRLRLHRHRLTALYRTEDSGELGRTGGAARLAFGPHVDFLPARRQPRPLDRARSANSGQDPGLHRGGRVDALASMPGNSGSLGPRLVLGTLTPWDSMLELPAGFIRRRAAASPRQGLQTRARAAEYELSRYVGISLKGRSSSTGRARRRRRLCCAAPVRIQPRAY